VEFSVFMLLCGVWYGCVHQNPIMEERHQTLPDGFQLPEVFKIKWPHFETSIVDSIGQKLATYRWMPKETPKALVFMIPGYGDYADTNANVAKLFVEDGFAAFSIDPPGFGRSDGLRGFVDNWNRTCSDILHWIRTVKQTFPQVQSYLLGESMGGAMALRLGLESPQEFKGLLLIAPAIKASENLYPILRKLVRYVAYIAPTVAVGSPLSHQEQNCLDKNIVGSNMIPGFTMVE